MDVAGLVSRYRFVVDFECFNHLNDNQRVAVGKAVNKITLPDATMLMLVWEPGRRRLLPQGTSPNDIESAFIGWKMIDKDPYAAQSELPGLLKIFLCISIASGKKRNKITECYCDWYSLSLKFYQSRKIKTIDICLAVLLPFGLAAYRIWFYNPYEDKLRLNPKSIFRRGTFFQISLFCISDKCSKYFRVHAT